MKAVKQHLLNARLFNQPNLRHLLFGNTSVDMDSVVGSILMSYLFRHTYSYTPVLNCSKEEFKYRFDIEKHLHRFGIDDNVIQQNLIFASDLPELGTDKVESVGLVDFNVLNKELAAYDFDSKVHNIIDHHVDSGLYGDTLQSKEIELVGSACSLVARQLFSNDPEFQQDTITQIEAQDLADLSLFISAPILIDSYNWAPVHYGSKWTDIDAQVFDKLK